MFFFLLGHSLHLIKSKWLYKYNKKSTSQKIHSCLAHFLTDSILIAGVDFWALSETWMKQIHSLTQSWKKRRGNCSRTDSAASTKSSRRSTSPRRSFTFHRSSRSWPRSYARTIRFILSVSTSASMTPTRGYSSRQIARSMSSIRLRT